MTHVKENVFASSRLWPRLSCSQIVSAWIIMYRLIDLHSCCAIALGLSSIGACMHSEQHRFSFSSIDAAAGAAPMTYKEGKLGELPSTQLQQSGIIGVHGTCSIQLHVLLWLHCCMGIHRCMITYICMEFAGPQVPRGD